MCDIIELIIISKEVVRRLSARQNLREVWIMKSELTKIPGIGNNMAEHLMRAGFPTIESLKGKNPDDVYADHDGQLPEEKQNWWDWKD
jgi:predicted flap endonuclease-1-like 5' DNA nuclease